MDQYPSITSIVLILLTIFVGWPSPVGAISSAQPEVDHTLLTQGATELGRALDEEGDPRGAVRSAGEIAQKVSTRLPNAALSLEQVVHLMGPLTEMETFPKVNRVDLLTAENLSRVADMDLIRFQSLKDLPGAVAEAERGALIAVARLILSSIHYAAREAPVGPDSPGLIGLSAASPGYRASERLLSEAGQTDSTASRVVARLDNGWDIVAASRVGMAEERLARGTVGLPRLSNLLQALRWTAMGHPRRDVRGGAGLLADDLLVAAERAQITVPDRRSDLLLLVVGAPDEGEDGGDAMTAGEASRRLFQPLPGWTIGGLAGENPDQMREILSAIAARQDILESIPAGVTLATVYFEEDHEFSLAARTALMAVERLPRHAQGMAAARGAWWVADLPGHTVPLLLPQIPGRVPDGHLAVVRWLETSYPRMLRGDPVPAPEVTATEQAARGQLPAPRPPVGASLGGGVTFGSSLRLTPRVAGTVEGDVRMGLLALGARIGFGQHALALPGSPLDGSTQAHLFSFAWMDGKLSLHPLPEAFRLQLQFLLFGGPWIRTVSIPERSLTEVVASGGLGAEVGIRLNRGLVAGVRGDIRLVPDEEFRWGALTGALTVGIRVEPRR